MVKKNTGGGKKFKKKKNITNNDIERALVRKDPDQEYAQVTKTLGNCRLEVNCVDGKVRLANIRGSMRKKIWMTVNDVVLVSIRDFEDSKCDIIYKYTPKEIQKLKEEGSIPPSMDCNDSKAECEEDLGIDIQEENLYNEDELSDKNKWKNINPDEL